MLVDNTNEHQSVSLSHEPRYLRVYFLLFLYIIYPITAGFTSAMQGAGRTHGWPLELRLAYYIPLALIVMSSIGLVCGLLAKPFRALRLPLWLLLFVGTIPAGEIIKLYVRLIVPVFDKLLPSGVDGGRVVDFSFPGNLESGIPTILTWIGINMFALIFLRAERFGYNPPTSARDLLWFRPKTAQEQPAQPHPTETPATSIFPGFLKRAGLFSIDDVIAIEAQQHYIKIHCKTGTKTILYRFSHAIDELGESFGVRVHRSWWVSKTSVESVLQKNGRMNLELLNGKIIPVSRTYHLKAHETFVD